MSERVAIVTGAAGGIGSATSALLADRGYDVVGIDRDWPGEPPTGSLTLDLRDHDALREAVAGVRGLRLLVNNAAVMREAALEELGGAEITATLDVNLTAAIVASSAAIAELGASARPGAIVNVGSVHAEASRWGLAAYAASKGGLHAFTRQAAVELGPRGIRVNAVVPGAVDTPMLGPGGADGGRHGELIGRTPLGSIASPQEIAEAIAFLADGERAGFITGEALTVDGGVLARLSSE